MSKIYEIYGKESDPMNGRPARKLRRTDIRLIEWSDGKPLKKIP